jgi:hypothetical protein
MISTFSAYTSGLHHARRQKKMLFFLYGFNLVIAYLLSLPFSGMLQKALDNTVMADKLLRAFDFTALVILIDEYGKGVTLGWPILVFAVSYVLLSTFFSGGIVKLFCSEINFTVHEFLTGCVKYFNRFFRLLLFTTGILLVIFVLYLLFSGLLEKITENTVTEFWPFSLVIIKWSLLALLLAWMAMLLDYTRIGIVAHDNPEVYRSLKQTFGFVLKNFFSTAGLYGLLLMTGVCLLLIYLAIGHLIPEDSGLGVVLFFVISQVYMISRVWLRLGFYSGQILNYNKIEMKDEQPIST